MCHEGYAEALCTRRRGSRKGCDGGGAVCEAPLQCLRAVVAPRIAEDDAGEQKASPTQTSCSAATATIMRLAEIRGGDDDGPIRLTYTATSRGRYLEAAAGAAGVVELSRYVRRVSEVRAK